MFRRILRSFQFAWQGVAYCFKTQSNIRIHSAAATAVLLAGCYFGLQPVEMAVLSLTIALVLAAEMLNTAVEKLVDLVSPDYHPLAKIVKDTAAGAVLTVAVLSLAVACFLFLPKLI